MWGIVISSFVHGLYDLNLALSNSEEFIIPIGKDFLVHAPSIKLVGTMFVITYFLGKDLIKWGDESKKEITKTPSN
jgi:hypothetical protein